MKVLRWQVDRGDVAAVGVLAVMSLLVFWQGLVSPADVIREDAAYYYQPYYTFAADEVRAGRLPLWNPYTLLGIPYHAGLQASLFYPLRWPLFWCDYVRGYVALLWVHYFLTGLMAYLFMRVALRVGPLAGLLGAMSIAFGGFAMGHLSHMTYFMAYPWFIGCLLFVWLSVQRAQWRWILWAGACVGLMGLIGAVHLLLVLGVLLGTYVVYHTIAAVVAFVRDTSLGWVPIVRPMATVVGALALGTVIAAVQLVPARALSKSSVRQQVSWQFINMACAHPVDNSIQMVVPWYFGNHRLGYYGVYNYHDMAHYTGVVVLLAAVLGAATIGRDRHLWFLIVLALAGFLVGAGKHLPVYRVLYDYVPGFAQLRNPTRVFWCADIALACLAAIGIERTLGRLAQEPRRLAVRIAVVVGGVVVVLVLVWAIGRFHHYANHPDDLVRWVNENPDIFNDQWKPSHIQGARDAPRKVIKEFDLPAWGNVLAALGAAVVLPILVWRGRSAGSIAAGGLVTILAVDLFALCFGTVQFDRQYYAIEGTPPRAKWLQEHLGLQRFLVIGHTSMPTPDDQVVRNRGMQFRIRSVDGVGGGILESVPRRQFCALTGRYASLMALTGVRYVLAERAINVKQFREVHKDNRYHVYENTLCLPMAFFVSRVVRVTDEDRTLGALVSPKFDVRQIALVEDPPPAETAVSRAKTAQVVRIDAVPGRWEIQTETDAPAQLLVSEGYSPGWRCRINGVSAPVFKTDYQLMSVPVPGGRSTVVLEYAPSEFRSGAILSVLGLLVPILLPVIGRFRRRGGDAVAKTRRAKAL